MTELRRLREERGLSQERLSSLSGVARPTIHRIELGQQKPHKSTIRKLSRVLEARSEEVAPELFDSPSEQPPGFKLTGEVYRRLEPYIRSVARRRSLKDDGLVDEIRAEELAGAGREGVAEAARKFDPKKANGQSFETWAKFYITNRIQDEVRRLREPGRESYLDDVLPAEWEGDIPEIPIDEDE